MKRLLGTSAGPRYPGFQGDFLARPGQPVAPFLCAPSALCLGEAEAPESSEWHEVGT